MRNVLCMVVSLGAWMAIVVRAHESPESPVDGVHRDAGPISDEIEKRWNERVNTLDTLEITYAVTELRKGKAPHASEPDGVEIDALRRTSTRHDVTLNHELTYLLKGGKLALVRRGEQLRETKLGVQVVDQTLYATFDGTKTMRYSEYPHVGGQPVLGEIRHEHQPSTPLLNHVELLATNLWLYPQRTLKAVGWNGEAGEVVETGLEVEGIRCLRMFIPHQRTNRYGGTLYVDASRDYAPIQWDIALNGVHTFVLDIGYADQGACPVPKHWSIRHANHLGRPDWTRVGELVECRINKGIDDSRFVLDFPEGSRILERKANGGTRYIEKKQGQFVRISIDDYGRIGP